MSETPPTAEEPGLRLSCRHSSGISISISIGNNITQGIVHAVPGLLCEAGRHLSDRILPSFKGTRPGLQARARGASGSVLHRLRVDGHHGAAFG